MNKPKISPLAKVVAAMMSIFMSAYGLFIISSEHYYGRTTKLGGAIVSTDGKQAVIMGVAIIVLGLTPMCLWAKSGKAAGIWAGGCMIVSVILFLAPVYIS